MKFGFTGRKIFIALLFPVLILNSNLYAQTKIEQGTKVSNSIDSKSTLLRITSNVKSASVYLNGHYQGDTPLVINNLPQGTYRLEIKKEHFKSVLQDVEVLKGISSTYNFELISMSGTVTINSVPSGPMIFVDGSQVFSNELQLLEGPHKIELKAFGYKNHVEWVNVKKDQDQLIQVQMTEIPFGITSLSADKSSFNPANLGTAGRVQLDFSVTGYSDGILNITDSSGRRIFYKEYIFNTWNYEFIWNGRDSYGIPVQDGVYTVTVQSDSAQRSIQIKVDSSINHSFMGITKSGMGLGVVPCAQTLKAHQFLLDFSLGLFYNSKDIKVEFFPFSFGFAWVPVTGFELSGVYSIHAGWNGGINGNITAKYAKEFVVSKGLHVDFGILARFGASSVMQLPPYGTDQGTGTGGGLVLGVDTGLFYGGISSEFVYGAASVLPFGGTDILWKNGIVLQVRSQKLSFGMWAALNSTWGEYKITYAEGLVEKGPAGGNLPMGLRSIDNGFEFISDIRQSSVRINARAGYICYFEQALFYPYGSAGFSLSF